MKSRLLIYFILLLSTTNIRCGSNRQNSQLYVNPMLIMSIETNNSHYIKNDSLFLHTWIENKTNKELTFFFNEILFELFISKNDSIIDFYNIDAEQHGFGKMYDNIYKIKPNDKLNLMFRIDNVIPKSFTGRYNLMLLYRSQISKRYNKDVWTGNLLSNEIELFIEEKE